MTGTATRRWHQRHPDGSEPAEVVVGRPEAGAPVETGEVGDDDVPSGLGDNVEGRRVRRMSGDPGQVHAASVIMSRQAPPRGGHQWSSTSLNMPRRAGATLSPNSSLL